MTERILAPGVTLRTIQTSKFKTSMLAVTFLEPLREETAALNALIPRVLRRGTRTNPDLERLSAALDELYGMNLEPIVRKKGETQCLGFWASVLDDAYVPGQTRLLESAASLLGEMVLHPAGSGTGFLEDYVISERANLVDKIRAQVNDKLQYALSRLRSEMCRGEAYGVDRYGSEESAQAITGEALFRRYQTLLETAPVYLYYCGSAEPERVEEAFRTALAELPRTDRAPLPETQAPAEPKGELRRFSDSLDVTQGKLILGFRLGGGIRGLEQTAPMMVLHAAYGSGTNSKLFMNVRERLSLCYFASSSLALAKGVMTVYSGVEFSNFQKAEDEILAQLEACRKGELTEEELETARRTVAGSLRTTLDAQGKLEEFWLNRFATGSDYTPQALAEAVESVTLEQVVACAQKIKLDSIYTLRGKED